MSNEHKTVQTAGTSAQLHDDRLRSTNNGAPTGPTVKLLRRKHRYDLARDRQYKNNLLWQVGFLELSNALDFPANVWNQIPTPLFAAVLMGLGGSVAILWSIFAFWDMHKSLANIRLLRSERRFLKRWQREVDTEDTLATSCLVQAYIDVNTRELGWEVIDRVMLDVCSGISGILVGTGALMAIRGDIDEVFWVSNLLSGYIGNSFLAPFALLNVFWAGFMWMRAGGESKELVDGLAPFSHELRSKVRRHGRKHRLYAVLNGATAVVGCVGSIMSATLWYGYVIIAPCVVASVFANLLWRHRMGYDRDMIRRKDDIRGVDILQTLNAIQLAIDAFTTGSITALPCFTLDDSITANVAQFMKKACLYNSFCHELSRRRPMSEKDESLDESIIDHAYLCSVDNDMVIAAGTAAITKDQRWLIYQERFLIEVYGRYSRVLEKESALAKQET
ncbi:hypothetical protein AMS68_005980 [Peltaster fructicola]|uniref:Integral membrane protein n=1 Tax=Peltaster fructicola TaxID=286661 RepID=A0A6H0Y0C1_9PEZI|nr:hypothetical protein AMS68_005980 [Peltaster fructicola]